MKPSDRLASLKLMQDFADHGGDLADQVAHYFAMFPPQEREQQIQIWLECMRDLMRLWEMEINQRRQELQ